MQLPISTQPDTEHERVEEPPPPGPRTDRLISAPRVFYPSVALVVAFVAVTAAFPRTVGDLLGRANTAVVEDLAWWYIAISVGFVFFCVWIAASHMGNIVLGKDDDKPEFGLFSWFAMLFAAGNGIGLVFFGVAEPLHHFAATPPGMPDDNAAEQAKSALDATFLHWGLQAWAIYAVVALAVAYSVHRKGNPISLRWTLRPLIGDRVEGFWGDVVDVISVLGTLFGVATSLGFGVSQISAGLTHLGAIDQPSTWLLVLLIIGITAIAVVSVVSGLDKGIKWLSDVNMFTAIGLMLLVLVVGPTVFILTTVVTEIGSYIQNFFQLAFNGMPFLEEGKAYLGGWTTLYWGWWISWAPFVGIFIARISKGRTVREFILGVLLVPVLATFMWFSVFGGSALYQEVFAGGGLVAEDGSVNSNTALFELLDAVAPWAGGLLGVVAIFLIVVFFVTSSDSGSLVVDMIASGGNQNPPVLTRGSWAVLEGAIAAVLLVAGMTSGGDPLGALQTMAILLAVPFSIVMVLMCFATAKALLIENRFHQRKQRQWLAEQVALELEANSSN